jgi:hypothetical protein
MTKLAHKTVDSKGRLNLGSEFAGRTVELERTEGALIVKLCRVVPDREAWLWENEAAYRTVTAGLRDARDGNVGAGPDLAAAFGFADEIPDDEG